VNAPAFLRGAGIEEARLLPGGAVSENWLLAAGKQRWVLRRDGRRRLGMGLSKPDEFAVLQRVHRAGVAVPEPVFCGASFFVMRWVAGSADVSGCSDRLAERLGRELALLQRVPFPCGAPPEDPVAARLADYASAVAAEPDPVAEWALRWLIRNKPKPLSAVLSHGDFRTGNYLVDRAELAAILDWEFAQWGDPDEDIGWFCSRHWRFGADEREAGGIAPRAVFLRGYEAIAGRRVDAARLRWWEAMAALRWLVIAKLQRDRFLVQGERSLDLALTGRRPAECALELLRLTAEG
jgi:aminoglycoside phosphotransferase (APT) family kinase protein